MKTYTFTVGEEKHDIKATTPDGAFRKLVTGKPYGHLKGEAITDCRIENVTRLMGGDYLGRTVFPEFIGVTVGFHARPPETTPAPTDMPFMEEVDTQCSKKGYTDDNG